MKRLFERLRKRSASPPSAPVASPLQAEPPRPSPPAACNNYVVVILDSCRYDTLMRAAPKVLRRLGQVERRWSYASWTAPSHYHLLMG